MRQFLVCDKLQCLGGDQVDGALENHHGIRTSWQHVPDDQLGRHDAHFCATQRVDHANGYEKHGANGNGHNKRPPGRLRLPPIQRAKAHAKSSQEEEDVGPDGRLPVARHEPHVNVRLAKNWGA